MLNNIIIGERIRNLREERGIAADELSSLAKLKPGQLEKIEKQGLMPGLAPLIRIARILGVRLGTFLDDSSLSGPVITRRESNRTGNHFTTAENDARSHLEFHPLAIDKADRNMDPFLITINPGQRKDFPLSSHEGEEFLFVLDGAIGITYGKESYQLQAGDSVYFDSVVDHHVYAENDLPAIVLAVVYTPF